MKELILKYKKNNPIIGYFIISKVFGLSIEDIIKVFWDGKFEIDKTMNKGYHTIHFFNENDKNVYIECEFTGKWEKSIYNKWNHVEYFENSDGYSKKWEFDTYGNEIVCGDSNGKWKRTYYNDMGKKIGAQESGGVSYNYRYVGEWCYKEFI